MNLEDLKKKKPPELLAFAEEQGVAVSLTRQWMAALRRHAYLASVDLAKEKGPFPLFDRDKSMAGEPVRALDEDVQEAIRAHGETTRIQQAQEEIL